ncbi:pyridoxal phosphate enzyme, YggS family [Opisthorchis viverrini]|uniref:Pyridoxal phosphate homeostasis protein n=1 Tax=Opisthorchis viverrini TaxID=6198 RepID=A0A1S8X499_OPIVI|nr:pyridoxal phosphate enzyme, YggS family [Opisthorchis viverrini]
MISKNLADVARRIDEAFALVVRPGQRPPLLVAVSKEKPVECIVEAYSCGQRHFGENKITSLCPEIKWHFIGRIQSNKIRQLASVPNLHMIQTIDSAKHALALDVAWQSICSNPLSVMLQVNTSGEEQKSGVEPSQLLELYKTVNATCPHLTIVGIMCIGRYGHDHTVAPNPDFLELVACRQLLCDNLGLKPEDIELSMGMSADFEHALLDSTRQHRCADWDNNFWRTFSLTEL